MSRNEPASPGPAFFALVELVPDALLPGIPSAEVFLVGGREAALDYAAGRALDHDCYYGGTREEALRQLRRTLEIKGWIANKARWSIHMTPVGRLPADPVSVVQLDAIIPMPVMAECPWCGPGVELAFEDTGGGEEEENWTYVECQACHACGPWAFGRNGATEAWNRPRRGALASRPGS